jgi:hypothetical protein
MIRQRRRMRSEDYERKPVELEGTFSKDEILKIIEANREAHRATFTKAVEVYSERLVAWHKEEVKRVLRGEKGSRFVHLPEPEDHTEDYDTVISMLRMHKLADITMAFHDYQNFVRDQWTWSERFAANTTSYTTGASR